MLIKNIQNDKYNEISLRFWNGECWEPDCFADVECNFATGKDVENGSGAILAEEWEIDEALDWWEEEIYAANRMNEENCVVLNPLSEEQVENGCEWRIFVNGV